MISQIEPGGSCDPSGTGSNSNQRAILMAKATNHDTTPAPVIPRALSGDMRLVPDTPRYNGYLLTDFAILLATAALGTFIVAAIV